VKKPSSFKLGKLDIQSVEYASQGNAVLGIRDSGKTYTATYLAERLFEAGIPFIAFDPIGVWRFLRVPGKGRGYPVVVAGGEDGDLPLTVEGAPEIVRSAMSSGVSLVIDLFDINLSKADWRRIVLACVNVLLHENKRYGLRHVFLEEAAEFVPQKVIDGHVYAAVEKLARMGGNSRLGYTLINQRSQEVAKAILELCENVFLHRQRGKNALENLDKWLSVAGASEQKAILQSLPSLPQGQCWAWLGGDTPTPPTLVKVPAKNSLHPDRRVMHGDDGVKPTGAVDVTSFVNAMRSTLVKVEEERKANDPKALKGEVARLTAKLKKASTPIQQLIDPMSVTIAEQRGFAAGFKEAHAQGGAQFRDLIKEASDLVDQFGRDFSAAFGGRMLTLNLGNEYSTVSVAPRRPLRVEQTRSVAPPIARAAPPAASDDASLTNPQRQLLQALAWWQHMGHDKPSRTQVAAIAGWKPKGSNLRNRLTELSSLGLVTYPQAGTVSLTDAGVSAAPSPDTSKTLIDSIRAVLTNPQLQLFDALLDIGAEIERTVLAGRVGWEATGSNLRNRLTELSQLEIVEYPQRGTVMLQGWVVS